MKNNTLLLCFCALLVNLPLFAQKDSAMAEVIKMRETLNKYNTQIPPSEQFVTLKKSTYDSLITLLNNQSQQMEKERMEIAAIRQRLLNTASIGTSKTPQVIYFESGSASLSKEDQAAIQHIVAESGSAGSYLIEGFADITGMPTTNERISHQRAEAVKEYMLRTLKVKPETISVKAYGSTRKVCDSDDKECLKKNRRVEITPKGN